MGAIPDTLIGDPDEMSKYNAQGPGEPARTSADEVRSQLNGGKRFATADKKASQRLIDHSLKADEGVRGFVFQAGTSADRYLNNDEQNRARVQAIVSPNLYGQSYQDLTPVAPAAPVPEPTFQPITPLAGGI